MEELLKMLNERGIEAIGAEGAPRSVHTEQRRITTSAETTVVEDEAPVNESEVIASTESSLVDGEPSAKSRLSMALAIDIPTLQSLSRRNAVSKKPESQQNLTSSARGESNTHPLGLNDEKLVEFIQQHGLKSRDMRYKKGALWVYHLGVDDNIAHQLKRWGFKLASGKGYWLV